MKTVIEMAREAGIDEWWDSGSDWRETFDAHLERFAELVRADEAKRADALAATIAGLRDIVTSDAESKVEFIARVRNVLGACPDLRVLHAVKAEREACAKVCEEMRTYVGRNNAVTQSSAQDCASAIRARSNT